MLRRFNRWWIDELFSPRSKGMFLLRIRARILKLRFVAVSFGFSDRPASELGADAVIHSYGELIPALERLAS